MSANLVGLIVRISYGIDSGFEGNLVGRMVLSMSMLQQEANQSMRRHAISSATGLATRPHLYRSKGLDLLSPSMQVLIGTVGRSAIGNGKQEGVAIVVDLKIKESDFVR